MALQMYINFNGNCRKAVEYYAKVFKSEAPQLMLYGDTPPHPDYPLTEETKKLVMHTQLEISGSTVMFSDVPPDMPFVEGNNFSLTIISEDMDEIKTLFDQLKVGGSVQMELQETFWSKLYGYVIDQFGIGWQFDHDTGEMK